MAPQIDTAQRRAEALLKSLGVLNQAGWEHGRERRIQYIVEFEQQARRAALEEASKVVRSMAGELTRDQCEGCGNEGDVAEGASNDALRYAADELDRMWEGVEK